jgi:hypothetical protein
MFMRGGGCAAMKNTGIDWSTARTRSDALETMRLRQYIHVLLRAIQPE